MKIEIIKGTETPVTKFFSNTPETDAAWACFKGYTEPLQDVQDLSRKLECERNEARFLLKAAQSALDAIHLEVGGWIKTMKENTD